MSDMAEPSARVTRLASNTLIVMSGYLASRVLGLVREIVIGARFGTSGEYDAYVAAFRIPDLLFLLLMGGALGSAFIPVFTEFLAKGEKRKAWRLATYTLNGSFVALLGASVIVAIFAEQLVPTFVAPGMASEQQRLATELTRILLLSPLFLGLGGIAMGILNSMRSFLLPAFAPVAYNLGIIFGAAVLAPFFGIYGLAAGVVIGAAVNFLVQTPGLKRIGYKYNTALNVHDPGLKEVVRLLLPRIFGQAAFQINFIVITNIASRLVVGSVSALNYAYLLMMLPHGVFAMSISTVVFPQMALQYGSRQLEELKDTLVKAMRTLIFLTLPTSVAFIFLGEHIVRFLLEFGSFTQRSTEMVSWALLFYSFGITAFSLVEILTRAFYALHDTKTPVYAAVVTIVLNIMLSLILMGPLAHGGLALSVAITTTLEMIILLVVFQRRVGGLLGRGMIPSLIRSLAASAVMATALFLVTSFFGGAIPGHRSFSQALWVMLLLAVGLGSYLLAAIAVRSPELSYLVESLQRRSARSLRK